ncbi:hypothetical protein [Planotetraspora sp. GP83]|uniref:hypothetical protein n=1 Tax=Planotetraspora sp. GP83 TaxID=3156264 RepID=UPI003510FBA3
METLEEFLRTLIDAELTARGMSAVRLARLRRSALMVADLHVRVVAATTGELLRQLIIDPTREYQPQKTKKPPNR